MAAQSPSGSIFTQRAGSFVPTGHARGPWDPGALHGGAPAALMTAEFERMQPGAQLRIARLGFELLRPVPSAPLTLTTSIVRPGRRVQELAGELRADGQLVCRGSALRVQPVPAGLPAAGPGRTGAPARMPPPEEVAPVPFALDAAEGFQEAGFGASAMEMRPLDDLAVLGPGRVWMRLRYPLLEGEPLTPLMRVAAVADFANGVSAVLPFGGYLFINADLSIHLHRPPEGEWVGLDARTILREGGTGLSESVLHDVRGPVGWAFQTLVVQPR